jgi:hypothetical protein
VIARAAHEPIRDLGQPYWPEFMNHHAAWEGRDGVACLTCAFNAPTAMRLLLGFGYDGPVRLWLDGEELHDDPNGTNPCISDRHLIPVRLRAGGHRLALAMDTQGGQAWGFALRWLVADGQAIPERWPSPV